MDLVGHAGQDLEAAEHHSDMAVVPAGVHVSIVLAGKRLVCSFGNGECIDVGAQEDSTSRRSV